MKILLELNEEQTRLVVDFAKNNNMTNEKALLHIVMNEVELCKALENAAHRGEYDGSSY